MLNTQHPTRLTPAVRAFIFYTLCPCPSKKESLYPPSHHSRGTVQYCMCTIRRARLAHENADKGQRSIIHLIHSVHLGPKYVKLLLIYQHCAMNLPFGYRRAVALNKAIYAISPGGNLSISAAKRAPGRLSIRGHARGAVCHNTFHLAGYVQQGEVWQPVWCTHTYMQTIHPTLYWNRHAAHYF